MQQQQQNEVKEIGIKRYRDFDEMPLTLQLLRGIYSHGFETPSDIQQLATVPIAKGGDVIAQAQADNGTVALNSPGIDPRVTVNSPEFNIRAQKISQAIDYAPKWIIILISLSL